MSTKCIRQSPTLPRQTQKHFFLHKGFLLIAERAFIVYSTWHLYFNQHSVNSKFFGNSLDLFKFDLLTFVLTQSDKLNLFYVPMITEPLPKERTPKYATYEVGCLNETLYQLMNAEFNKDYSDISVIKKYFVKRGISLSILSSNADETKSHFNEDNRKGYFASAIEHYQDLVNKTLVYIDPDVGSDIGVTRRYRSNKKSYVRRLELLKVKNCLKVGDFMSYFQHLGNSNYSFEKRIADLHDCFGDWVLFVGYTRIQAGFVFVFNDEATYMDKRRIIQAYFRQYGHLKHKDKFIIYGKPPQSGGFLI